MSIAGRNQWRGSTVHVYRPIKAERDGGLTGRTFVRVQDALKLAIHTITAEITRQVWGQEASITAMAVLSAALDVRVDDALVVVSGEHAGQRFYVDAALPMRRMRQIGLTATTDVIDDSIAGTDPDRHPLDPQEAA